MTNGLANLSPGARPACLSVVPKSPHLPTSQPNRSMGGPITRLFI